jgi:hypothetical protein
MYNIETKHCTVIDWSAHLRHEVMGTSILQCHAASRIVQKMSQCPETISCTSEDLVP